MQLPSAFIAGAVANAMAANAKGSRGRGKRDPWTLSWLSPAVAGDRLAMRLFHITAIVAGLNQKSATGFAWDVQWSAKVLADLRRRRASAQFLGITTILLRRVHAKLGQELVGVIARQLLCSGRTWDKRALLQIAQQLSSLDPADAGLRHGRLAQHSGTRWFRKIVRLNKVENLRKAGASIGRLYDAVTGSSTVVDVCVSVGIGSHTVVGGKSLICEVCEELRSQGCSLPAWASTASSA